MDYSSTLQKEATCSSETSVDFQRTIRRYIPEDRTLHHSLTWLFNDAAASRLHSVDDKMINECGAVAEMITGKGNRNTRRKARPNANLSTKKSHMT
jgi:hypothetical protein